MVVDKLKSEVKNVGGDLLTSSTEILVVLVHFVIASSASGGQMLGSIVAELTWKVESHLILLQLLPYLESPY